MLEYKLFDAPQVKMLEDDNGSITGYASTFANFDDVGERVVAGAFKRHLGDFLKDGFIAIGHDWSALPIATPIEAIEDDHGLFVRGAFHSHSAAQDARTVMRERIERGKSVKLSIGYEVLADEYTDEGRLLKDVKLYEWSFVTVPANPMASVTAAKGIPAGVGPLALYGSAVEAAVSHLRTLTHEAYDLEGRRVKAGRMLSDANIKVVDSAIEAGDHLLKMLRDLRERADTTTEPQKANTSGHAEVNALRAAWARQQQRLRELGAL